MEVSYRFGFDAAHHFDNFPDGHRYRGIHGHSFQVEVALAGEPDAATGFVTDLGDVEVACGEVREALDHHLLNDVEGLGTPTLENIARYIFTRAHAKLPEVARVTVRRDSCGQSCSYSGR